MLRFGIFLHRIELLFVNKQLPHAVLKPKVLQVRESYVDVEYFVLLGVVVPCDGVVEVLRATLEDSLSPCPINPLQIVLVVLVWLLLHLHSEVSSSEGAFVHVLVDHLVQLLQSEQGKPQNEYSC